MKFESKNMNYIFNVEYFKDIENLLEEQKRIKQDDTEDTTVINEIRQRNKAIEKFVFPGNILLDANLNNAVDGWRYQSFILYTEYPGLLVGAGYPHDAKLEEAIKCGFTFDYVTGIPYIPGSSLKGMLRSFFPGDQKEVSEEYASYIRELLKKDRFDVLGLKDNIFEGNDIFLGAFPDLRDKPRSIMKMDYITPHKELEFNEPNPISMIKIKPDVPIIFNFLLTDYTKDDEETIIISAEEKKELFKNIIIDMGIGAKTNVGFGRLK